MLQVKIELHNEILKQLVTFKFLWCVVTNENNSDIENKIKILFNRFYGTRRRTLGRLGSKKVLQSDGSTSSESWILQKDEKRKTAARKVSH